MFKLKDKEIITIIYAQNDCLIWDTLIDFFLDEKMPVWPLLSPAIFLLSVIPITTLFKRKPVDVEIDYLPSEKSNERVKFLRQVSLPAYQAVKQSSLPVANSVKKFHRLNSSPGHEKKNEGIYTK